jgi:MFS family permease
MAAGMLVTAGLLLVLPALRSFAPLLLLTSLYGAAFAATSATSMAWITDRASRRNFGTAHGAYGTIFDVGDAAGPVAAGFLIGTLGYGPAFRILALPILVLVALVIAARKFTSAFPPRS